MIILVRRVGVDIDVTQLRTSALPTPSGRRERGRRWREEREGEATSEKERQREKERERVSEREKCIPISYSVVSMLSDSTIFLLRVAASLVFVAARSMQERQSFASESNSDFQSCSDWRKRADNNKKKLTLEVLAKSTFLTEFVKPWIV